MFSSQRRIDPAPASTHPKECTQCGCSSTSNALLECRNRRCATSADGAAGQTRASNPEGLRAASRPRCWERDTKRLPIGKPSVSHAVLLPWRRSGKRLRRELCVVRAGVVAQSWRHQSKSDVPAPCRLARASRARSRGRSSSTRRAAPRETRRNLAVGLAPPTLLSAVMTSAFSQYALYSKKNQEASKSKTKLRFKFNNQRKCSECIQLTSRSMNHGRLADAPPFVGGEP